MQIWLREKTDSFPVNLREIVCFPVSGFLFYQGVSEKQMAGINFQIRSSVSSRQKSKP